VWLPEKRLRRRCGARPRRRSRGLWSPRQTRFVLKKAIAMGHRILVVINKIDKPDADPASVVDKTFDLFCELGASDEQTDFPIVYTSAINRVAGDAACSGWPGLARPGSQQPMRPPTAPEVRPLAQGCLLGPERRALAYLGAEQRLRRRCGACPRSPIPPPSAAQATSPTRRPRTWALSSGRSSTCPARAACRKRHSLGPLAAARLATPVSPGACTAGSGRRSTRWRSDRVAQSPVRGRGGQMPRRSHTSRPERRSRRLTPAADLKHRQRQLHRQARHRPHPLGRDSQGAAGAPPRLHTSAPPRLRASAPPRLPTLAHLRTTAPPRLYRWG